MHPTYPTLFLGRDYFLYSRTHRLPFVTASLELNVSKCERDGHRTGKKITAQCAKLRKSVESSTNTNLSKAAKATTKVIKSVPP